MDIAPSRLRRGEWVAAAGAVLLLVFLFALPWYASKPPYRTIAALQGVNTSPSGWSALSHVRWLLLLTALAALALAFLQASRQAPALPITTSVILSALALISVLTLIYRVLINQPGADSVVDQQLGAYLGLASSVVILYGACSCVRREGVAERDGPGEIAVAALSGSATGSAGPSASSRS